MTNFLEEIVHGKHIFIVGASNTGSTVLYRLLAYHPELAWFSQWSNRDWTVPGRISFPFSRVIDRLGRRMATHPWSKWTNVSLAERFYQRIVPTPGDGGAAWTWVCPQLDHRDDGSLIRRVAAGDLPIYGRETVPEIRERLLVLVHRCLRNQRKWRFLAKRPPLCFAVPALAEILPSAKFIHIVRDGKACIISRALQKARDTDRLDWIRMVAKEWEQTMRFMTQVQQEIGVERLINIHYEGCCGDVRGTMTELLNFCNLPADNRILTNIPNDIRSTNSRRFNETSDEYKREIMAIAGKQLESWGYSGF